jgi:penicillin amidase
MTDSATRGRLRRLGDGATIEAICAADRITRAAFDAWWAADCARRLPRLDGAVGLPVHGEAEILRDARGVPHLLASTDHDLFVAYGYAMAQDRLFQMDLRRRRAMGRLAEVLGDAGLDVDILARTMDLPRLAVAEFDRLSVETRALFEAFAAGVNAAAEEAREQDALPIEFDLLAYEPEPWTALDCVRCVTSWRWQLTGRPWVISVPELAKRTLGMGPRYDAFIAFMRDEADDRSIIPAADRHARDVGLMPIESVAIPRTAGAGGTSGQFPVGVGPTSFEPWSSSAASDPMGGSNNWVVAGSRSRSGKPILASDPHMPYEAASSFYEVHLSGGSFECAGAGLVGYPGLTFGRNRHLAWGITNNICSQRDLYLEREPGAVREWREETIGVRGRAEHVPLTVKVTEHGPIVDRLLPAAAAPGGPVSMRWVGQLACDWPSGQLRLNRASTVDEAMAAVRGWLSPTFSLLIADDLGPGGHIAFTNTGTIPVRGRPERGYRDAANRDDAWLGLIPPAGMPQTHDPGVGWLGSANNRPAPDDFPYPLSGTWDEGLRHRRIGQLAEELTPHDLGTIGRMHTDVHVGRAEDRIPAILAALNGRLHGIDLDALEVLRTWDRGATPDSAGAAIWEVFWTRWAQTVAAARFPRESADFVANWMNGFAGRMLTRDEIGWFASNEERLATLVGAFREAVAELRTALGDRPRAWRWGALHAKGLHHPLSAVGDLGALLDQPARPAGGDIAVLNNVGFAGGRTPAGDVGYARNWEGTSGAGYRLVADLGNPAGSAWTVTLEGQSAVPGSPNRSDQLDDFLAGRYHEIPLDRSRAEAAAVHRLTVAPRGRHD